MAIQVDEKQFWRKLALYIAGFGGIAVIVRGLFSAGFVIFMLWFLYSFFNYMKEDRAAFDKRSYERHEKFDREREQSRQDFNERWEQLNKGFFEFKNRAEQELSRKPSKNFFRRDNDTFQDNFDKLEMEV